MSSELRDHPASPDMALLDACFAGQRSAVEQHLSSGADIITGIIRRCESQRGCVQADCGARTNTVQSNTVQYVQYSIYACTVQYNNVQYRVQYGTDTIVHVGKYLSFFCFLFLFMDIDIPHLLVI